MTSFCSAGDSVSALVRASAAFCRASGVVGAEQPGGQRLELFDLGLRRLLPMRECVACGDQQGVGAVDAAGFDQKLEGFVGLEADHGRLAV